MKGITFHTTPNPSPVLPSPGIASGVVASTCKPPTARITYGMVQQQAIWCSSKPYGMAHLQGGKVKEESLSSSCRVSLLPVVMVSWCHVVAVCVMLLRYVSSCCGMLRGMLLRCAHQVMVSAMVSSCCGMPIKHVDHTAHYCRRHSTLMPTTQHTLACCM